jgi:hypothetical protein
MNPHPHPPSRAPNPTPRTTAPRSRTTSNATHRAPLPLPLPPQAPKPSRDRRPIDPSAASTTQTNLLFNIPREQSLVPRASCGKVDDILAPPDAQSCPFAKAGLKVLGMGVGAYGELEGWLEWPVELYANERKIHSFYYFMLRYSNVYYIRSLACAVWCLLFCSDVVLLTWLMGRKGSTSSQRNQSFLLPGRKFTDHGYP